MFRLHTYKHWQAFLSFLSPLKKASELAFVSMNFIKCFNPNKVPLKWLDTVSLMAHSFLT